MINVCYLLSYDYSYIFLSINQIYDFVDKIHIAIDKDRLTWGGNKFEIPGSFFEKLNEVDNKKIIDIYEDNFYIPALSPIECETRERNMLLKRITKGWIIQLDSDEYVLNIKEVLNYLKKHWYLNIVSSLTPVSFHGNWVNLFKKTKTGFLYIANKEPFPFITNFPQTTIARYNRKIVNFDSGIEVIHQSWARSEEEVLTKIKNWGHKNDFDTISYFSFWENLHEENYREANNFHPLKASNWSKLSFIECSDSLEFIKHWSKTTKESYCHLSIFTYLCLLLKLKYNYFKNRIKTLFGTLVEMH